MIHALGAAIDLASGDLNTQRSAGYGNDGEGFIRLGDGVTSRCAQRFHGVGDLLDMPRVEQSECGRPLETPFE